MAVKVFETTASRNFSYDSGKVNATRIYKVYDDAAVDTLTNPATVRALFGTATTPDAMPAKGDLFVGESTVYAKSYNIQREPSTNIWTVTWTYSNALVGVATAQPGEAGFVEWTLDIQAQFVDTYIEQIPAFPTNGDLATAVVQITNGTQIDIYGTPLSRLKYTSELVINETIQNSSGVPTIIATMRAARGKRNNASWEGFARGTVLYTGGQIRRAGVSLYTVTHRFIEDSEYHLIQVPERDQTGQIPTADINGAKRARKVFWRQPFPASTNFASISPNW